MRFSPPLIPAALVRRYKRFLADVELADGSRITVHCPNSGSMLGCADAGIEARISLSANPKRKYPHTLEMVRPGGVWVGINTARTNSLVEEAVRGGIIPEFAGAKVRREVRYGKSRLDFLLERSGEHIYMEVKNCTLARKGTAMFPDAVTARGKRHLEELVRAKKAGHRAVIFFCVQREDADRFAPAAEIDPAYAAALAEAAENGVEVMAWQARVNPEEIRIFRPLTVEPGRMERCDGCGAATANGNWQGRDFLCPACLDEQESCGCSDG